MTNPDYEAGWIAGRNVDGSRRYEAFLRPYSEDWYDLFACETWWQALAKAMEIAGARNNCAFVGGIGEVGQ